MRDILLDSVNRQEVPSQKPHHMHTACLLKATEALLAEDRLPATGRWLPHPAENVPWCWCPAQWQSCQECSSFTVSLKLWKQILFVSLAIFFPWHGSHWALELEKDLRDFGPVVLTSRWNNRSREVKRVAQGHRTDSCECAARAMLSGLLLRNSIHTPRWFSCRASLGRMQENDSYSLER